MQTYGSLAFDSEGCWVLNEVKPHVSLRLKQLFPRIPQSSRPPYKIQDSLDSASDLKWFTSRYPFRMTKEDEQYLLKQEQAYRETQACYEAILNPEYIPKERLGFKDGHALRSYQATAVDFVEAVSSALILDEIGLGKTYEGLGLATIKGALPIVFVCEPHLQPQWYNKAIEILDASVHMVQGNKPYSLPPADIYIMKYNQLQYWVDVLSEGWLKSIVFDEVQNLRRGTEAAKGIAATHICNLVTYKVGLTASLIYNYGIESYNIANILRPGILGSKQDFLREWCSEQNDKGIVLDPDALGAYLREQNLIIRRTKADVGQQARQLTPHIEWVDHNRKAVSDLEELTKQLAIKTFSSDFAEAGNATRQFDLRMRQMTGVAKAASVAAYVRMFVNSGESVLVFGWHREVYDIWLKELADLSPAMFTGSESPSKKEREKQRFISGETKVMFMSLGSGAGTDGLQYVCSTAIFGELAWSSEVHRQSVGRLDRDGQTKEVFSFYVATQFGSDPEMLDVLGIKKGQSTGIMDPYSGGGIAKQTDPDRIKNLASTYLKAHGIKLPEDKAKSKSKGKIHADIECITSILKQGSYSTHDELLSQNQIEQNLIANNIVYEREKRVANGIIDFFLPETGIAIEVKAHKQWQKMEVYKQCERYCNEEEVKGLILATAKFQGLPESISGKPTTVFQLSISAL